MSCVLVIGAGHNGLVAAIQLAAHGLDVTVLEHAPHPGGASSSTAATLPGFVHDHCAAFVPMAAASPAIQELRLDDDGLRWIDPPTILAHPFDDGSAIALRRDVGATCESLACGAGPGAADGWKTAMARMLPIATPLVESVLSPLPAAVQGTRVAAGLNRELVEWTRRMLGSVEALGLDLFDGDRRATAWLAGSAQHSGLPPSTTLSGAFGFLLQLLAHSHGWPLPRGGMGELTAALVRRAEREGVHVRCGASVRSVLISRGRSGGALGGAVPHGRGRVAGVELHDGEQIAADAVVSTVSAGLLARLLPPGALPGRLHRRLARWRYATAPFKLDYALSAPVPWTALEPREAAVVHVGGALEQLSAAAQEASRGELPWRPALVVGQQSLLDPTRAPAGRHTLYVYGHVPARYPESDEQVAERIEAQLERFAPGFRDIVLARATRSPAQSERDNPSLVGGDLGGGSYELDQQLVFRPDPRMIRYRTPLRGLYVAGASTHPGGAVHGMSGRGAAHALLKDRRLRPWRVGGLRRQ
ncbi:NAD(P)/FAD-dependent oxidoreductase [Conexibacter sp. CPCC 206217]|uniref:phytoene desaturase family protein n=1 Tax=Conexibacter sp. CPCC 206217 TaxID=3064574 RepID=UPI00271C8D94|nr:NAD(P)/FAD-dependent oxidoreductase [Conexibacter sp. CPCC 206217]MDO8212328.1 NAD(P)/FAD-dependent oxidoreductase [Conexibacter sp. CPCC 206217]